MEVKDDAGYFFSRIGELCLTAESELQSQQRRTAPKNLLVCSNRFGITAWADGRGLYVAHTADLLQQLEPWNDDETEQPPRSRSAVCLTSSVWPGILGLQLCCNDTLLAVYDATHMQLHALHDLAVGMSSTPLLRAAAPMPMHALHLQPSAHGSPPELHFVAVWGNARELVRGVVGGGALSGEVVARGVVGAAWSPDGSMLAYGVDDRVVVCHARTKHEFSQTLDSTRIEPAAGEALAADSVVWLSDTSLCVGAQVVDASDGAELPLAVLLYVHWEGAWEGLDPPASLESVDFDLCPVLEDAYPAGTGPYFASALLPPWQLLLMAHCKAADEHLRLLAYGDPPSSIEVADDKRALRVPMARDDADNFVIGIAVATTHTAQSPPSHPTNPTAPPLVPQPVLLLATSDGKLRGYFLGDTDRGETCVSPPTALAPLDAALKTALTAAATAPALVPSGAAAASREPAAQPGLEAASREPAAQPGAAAALEEGEGSTGSSPVQASGGGVGSVGRALEARMLEARAQQAALPDSEDDVGDDEEASDADSTAEVTSSPPPKTRLFAFADDAATTAPRVLDTTASSKSTTSPADATTSAVKQTATFTFAPKPLDVAPGAAARPALPTPRMPSAPQQPPTPPPVQPQPVTRPVAQLTEASPELAKMEAAFLATLLKVRQLGSEFDAKFETLKAQRAARQQRGGARLAGLQSEVATLQRGLQEGRTSFANLQQQLLDMHARCAALKKHATPSSSGGDPPLPSALALRIADAQHRLGQLGSRAEDLAAALSSLEARQRAFAPTPSSRHVYASLGHLTQLLAAQSAAVEALATRLDGLRVDADDGEADAAMRVDTGDDGGSPCPSRRTGRSMPGPSTAPASSWHSVRTSPLLRASPGGFLVPEVTMEGAPGGQAWGGERGQALATLALRMAAGSHGGVRVTRVTPHEPTPEAPKPAGLPSLAGAPSPVGSPARLPGVPSAPAHGAAPVALDTGVAPSMQRVSISVAAAPGPTAQPALAAALATSTQSAPTPAAPRAPAQPVLATAAAPAASAAPAKAAKAKKASSQPPIPSRAMMQQAQQRQDALLKGAAPSSGARTTAVPTAAPTHAAAPEKRAADGGAQAAAASAAVPKVKRASQPPIPSKGMMQAAQSKFAAQLGTGGAPVAQTTAEGSGAAAASTPAFGTAASTAAPAFGATAAASTPAFGAAASTPAFVAAASTPAFGAAASTAAPAFGAAASTPAFGAAASSPAFGAAASSPAFGAAASTPAFGAAASSPAFGTPPTPTPDPTPSFAGFGFGTPAAPQPAQQASPFGKGLSFGTPATPPSGFGAPPPGAFGGFGAAPLPGASPATPPAFGQPNAPGGFGVPAMPAPAFGAPAALGAGAPSAPFGAAAAPPAGGSNAFAAAASAGGGFAAFASGGGGFGGFGAGQQSPATPQPPSSSSNPNMWAARR